MIFVTANLVIVTPAHYNDAGRRHLRIFEELHVFSDGFFKAGRDRGGPGGGGLRG
jgi:hypothetical protein